MLFRVQDCFLLRYFLLDDSSRISRAKEVGKRLKKNLAHRVENMGVEFKTSSDELIPISLSASLLFDKDGTWIGSVGVFKDMRELNRLKEAEMMAKLSHAVAHEIGKTSGIIPANVFKIREELNAPSASIREKLDRIEKVAYEATEFSKELLDFSERHTKDTKDHNINDLINEAIKQTDYKYQKNENWNGAPALKQFSKSPIICHVAERPFIRIIRNLITNAYQAMGGEDNQRLIISTYKNLKKQVATIEISDTGCGITDDNLKRIYDPDFSTKKGGSGIGLWLVKFYLNHLKGNISVKSNLEHGTTFTLEISLKKDEVKE